MYIIFKSNLFKIQKGKNLFKNLFLWETHILNIAYTKTRKIKRYKNIIGHKNFKVKFKIKTQGIDNPHSCEIFFKLFSKVYKCQAL